MFERVTWHAIRGPSLCRPISRSAIAPLKRRKPPCKPKGAVAKITRDLKEGIIDAAVNVGRDGAGTDGLVGFLEDTALHHRKAFCGLFMKLLPLNLNANVAGPVINSVQIVSVPSNTYLTSEDMQRIQDGAMPAIEHLPQEIVPEPVPEPPASQLATLEAWLATMPEEKLTALAGIVAAGER